MKKVLFSKFSPFKGGDKDNTSRAVLVPGTTMGTEGKSPPVIRALDVIICPILSPYRSVHNGCTRCLGASIY